MGRKSGQKGGGEEMCDANWIYIVHKYSPNENWFWRVAINTRGATLCDQENANTDVYMSETFVGGVLVILETSE